LKFTGQINNHSYESRSRTQEWKKFQKTHKHRIPKGYINWVWVNRKSGEIVDEFPEEKKYETKTVNIKRHIFELVDGDINQLDSVLCHYLGGKRTNYEFATVKNGFVEISESIIDRCEKMEQCKLHKYYLGPTQFCPLSLCDIEKKHFHVNGKNVICGCVRLYLTFFI